MSFGNPITMDEIRSMKRRSLTEAEKLRPYAKYFYKELAEIPATDLEKVNAGAVDPSRATSIQNRNDLMKPGYLEVETGYTVMPDGSGFAATLVKMPGVTPTMLDWWFNWHPLEGLRYAMWCPVAHTDISAKNPSQHLDNSGAALRERNYGSTTIQLKDLTWTGR
jgi:phloretin hydrolase